jgi:hypothetical protein
MSGLFSVLSDAVEIKEATGCSFDRALAAAREFARWERENLEAANAEPESNVIYGVDFKNKRRSE